VCFCPDLGENLLGLSKKLMASGGLACHGGYLTSWVVYTMRRGGGAGLPASSRAYATAPAILHGVITLPSALPTTSDSGGFWRR
jgi:hypothetical protein